MEKKKYNITVGNETKEFEEGTTYQAVAKEFCGSFSHPAVLAVEGENRLQELRKTVEKDCELKFITTADAIGHETYKRSLCFLLVKAVHDVAGHDKIERVRIHFSVDKGYYCTVDGDIKITEQFLADVAKRMRWLSDEKIPIKKKTIHTDDAIELFHRHGMYDKEKLFEYRRVSKVNIYSINEFEDYYYGYMVPDTGYLKYFKLYPYDEGFVMQMPTRKEPEKLPPFTPSPKIFQVQKEAEKWGEMMGVSVVGELNEKISKGKMQELLLISEALQEGRISKIAEQIIERGGVKFVMIAGPSSSGKTTFSHRLSIQLAAHGMKPHPIAVDNYFVNREDTPRDENGNLLSDEIRLTKFGKALRATSLDELPEIFNILKGDMSLIGPRPLLVQYLPRYNEEQHHRHDVRPGLTGYAQAHGRNAVSWEEKFAMDVWYVNHVSMRTDIRVIIDTIKTVLKKEGISSETSATMEEFMGSK